MIKRANKINYSLTPANDERGLNLYAVVRQEVDLGLLALERKNADLAVTLFRSGLRKLSAGQPFYDHLVHNLLLGYKLLIEQLFEAGRADAADYYLREALDLDICGEMAGDTDFRRRFAGALQDLGLVLFRYARYAECVACCRKAIAVHRGPGSYVNLTNALAASARPAELSDFTTDITRQQLGTHIFIACVPKSASTFLKNLLVSLTGFKDVFMVYAAGQNEHELYLPTVCENACLDTVTQQHCRASFANVQMMQAFGIRPVVLVRNIFDSVMSLLDFYDRGAFFNSYFRADYPSLDDETKIDLLIDNVVPWYFQFVASWSLVEKQKNLEIFWLGYEELIRDKTAAVRNVLAFYGLGAARRHVEQKIGETESENRKIRFNKGITGRGETELNERQKERIRRLAGYYPSTDFGRLGL